MGVMTSGTVLGIELVVNDKSTFAERFETCSESRPVCRKETEYESINFKEVCFPGCRVCDGRLIPNGNTSGTYEGGRCHRWKERQRDHRGVHAGNRTGVSTGREHEGIADRRIIQGAADRQVDGCADPRPEGQGGG